MGELWLVIQKEICNAQLHMSPKTAAVASFPKIPRPAFGRWQRTLGFMLDEKMFAFYYELSPNSR